MASKKEALEKIGNYFAGLGLEKKVQRHITNGSINTAVNLYLKTGKVEKALNLLVEKGDLYKAEDIAREYGLDDLAETYKAMAELEPQPLINS